MRAILPGGVALAEGAIGEAATGLLPEEEALVLRVTAKRRREFAAGRRCAHRALEELGIPLAPVLRDPGGAPRWPAEVAGSITHAGGYCAAAVGRRSDVGALGIDAELRRPLGAGAVEIVCTPDERSRLASAGGDVPWETVVFSAKESVYKALAPATGRPIGFHDVALRLDPAAGAFRAFAGAGVSEPVAGLLARVEGRFRLAGPYVLTTARIPGIDHTSGSSPGI
jgi:4'-phosphopantetheinyl transferase EntD